jgi:hypothetical protein
MNDRIIFKNISLRITFFACIALGSLMYGAGCRHDPETAKPHVASLQFEIPRITMKIGERQAVKVIISPTEARKHHKVEYTASVEGYVTINETSNDGCVLTAEQGGTVVIVAKADGYTAYLEVEIESEEYVQIPYIMVPTQVIEVLEGARKSVQVSLYNGSAVDQQQFLWEVETGKDNISINPTGNTVVVQGEKRGAQKIIVSHEKSEYTAEILVFVLGVDEQVRYITSGQNVITMTAGGPSHELAATLVGGSATDISGFTFSINEENPCIEILPSNNSCNIIANRKGTAVIRIIHPLAEYPLEVRVIVLQGEESYIELDKTFMMLDPGKGDFINASMGGYYLENWNANYSCTLKGDNGCIEVSQTNFSFYVLAKSPGSCVLEISNSHMEYSREALVVVRDPTVVPTDEWYITTSQNVIQLEIGQSVATQLSIQLINGIEADKAGFEWTVEDGRIVIVEALDLPGGKGVNYLTKSMVKRKRIRAIADIKSVASTLALVTPKKIGSTKIVITHPKSKSAATVICKIYPRGTFGGMQYVLVNENEQEGGLIKVDTTQPDKKVRLKLGTEGDATNIGKLQWQIKPCTNVPDIVASLHEDASGLENEIHGAKKGVNKLIVNNEETLKYPFEAALMVGTPEELAQMAALYVDQVYHTVAVGQNVSIPILNSNMLDNKPNSLSESDQYYAEGYDKKIVVATMIKNRLLLQGLSDGKTTVIIKNKLGTDIIPVEIQVTVVPGVTTIDKPYMLTGPNFIGMNWGDTNVELKVKLSGDTMDASAIEKDRVKWSSSNSTIVKVTNISSTGAAGEIGLLQAGNGANPSTLTAPEMTGQANIIASHDRSINDKVIVAYVVPPGIDPLKSVVIGIAQDHWLLKPDDEIMLQLLTNADETPERNINKIKWLNKEGVDFKDYGADPVIDVDYSGDRAMVRAKAQGSTVITVTHPAKVIDLKIYISVSTAQLADKKITLPTIVELIIDENKVLTTVAEGLSQAEINNIEWILDDPSVVSISSELPLGSGGKIKGGKLFIKGKARGQAWLTVSQGELGYFKKILIVCARTYEELANTYVMACEESYFRLKKGEVKAVSLVYGSAGFPEKEKQRIEWKDTGNNNVVKIHPPVNDHADIEAIDYGIATVRVNHELIFKPVDLTFEVSPELTIEKSYQFIYNSMIGLVVWNGADGVPEQYVEPYTKEAALAISPAGLSYNGIEWKDEEKPDKGIVAVTPGGTSNVYLMTGKKKGQTYIKFSHKSNQIPDDARILVYTAESVEELQQMFPIGISKPNYLLTAGGPEETIKITVPSQSMTGLNNADYKKKLDKIGFDFGSGGSNIIKYAININENNLSTYRQEISIQGRNPGNCYFDIKYEGKLIERIYISVKAQLDAEMNRRIVTESIIGLTPTTVSYITSIGCNLTQDEKTELEWESDNPNIVEAFVDINDKTKCRLTAKGTGETEVVVSFRGLKRYIKIYVDENVGQYKAVNLDNRYYQIRKNETLSLTAFHAALPCASDDQWQFSNSFDNKVVELKPNGKDKVNITGINEGIATITLSNSECMTDVTFMVEVNNTAPSIEAVVNDGYLTAFKTVYALDPSKKMDVTRVTVSGVRMAPEDLVKVEWTVISEEIDGVVHKLENEPYYKPVLLTFNNKRGTFVDLLPNGKTGTVVIRADHPNSVNSIDITVICDTTAVLVYPSPHITADRETVKLQLNEEATVVVGIADLGRSYDIALFTAVSDNEQKVTVETTGNHIKIKGVNFGQGLVTVTHPELPGFAKKIVVIVMSGDTSIVYLTTKQNFVVLEKGGYQAVEVELVGYNDVNSRNYIWDTDDHETISINDSGRSAVITAKNVAKTAKITIQHIACLEYPLVIYVRVTEKNAANPTYITTPNNIVSIKEGAVIQVKANLVNGGGHELSQFTWSTNDKVLIELNYSGDTAMIKGVQPGTARIQIWHPSSLNSINILVVVEPLEPNNGIYISTDSQLIEMTTSESQRAIKVRLVGGEPEDVYGFRWEISSYISELKQGNGQSYQPVTILSNADNCYIQPSRQKYEGEAIITVSHPKTSYKLDIKVIIADSTDIQFAQSYITINQFEQVNVGIKAPSNGRMNVVIDDKNIANAFVTEKLCTIEGVQEGTTIIRVSNLSGTKSDELVVRVNKVDLTGYAYIHIANGLVFDPDVGTQQQINVQVIGAKTPEDEKMLVNLLMWSADKYDLIDKNPGSSYDEIGGHYTWRLLFTMKKSGELELCFKFNTEGIDSVQANLLNNIYPLSKSKTKTVYVHIREGDNLYSVDKQNINLYEGDFGDMITATIKQKAELKASQITWTIEDDSIVKEVKIVSDEETGTSRLFVETLKPGATYITVGFGTIHKIVYVTVLPVKYVKAERVNVSVSPGTTETQRIWCNPPDRSIDILLSTTDVCLVSWRKYGSDDLFVSQTNQSHMTGGGEAGYEVLFEGGEYQGTVAITFQMSADNEVKKTQVTAQNIKNFYIRWINRQSLRFDPSTNENDDITKIYYEINPPIVNNKPTYLRLDTLAWEDKFSVECGIEDISSATGEIKYYEDDKCPGQEDKMTKYIKLKYPKGKTAFTTLPALRRKVPFTVVNTVAPDPYLDVYINYEKIDVDWTGRITGGAEFDSATYAIILPPTDNYNNNYVKLKMTAKTTLVPKSNTNPNGATQEQINTDIANRQKALSWIDYFNGNHFEFDNKNVTLNVSCDYSYNNSVSVPSSPAQEIIVWRNKENDEGSYTAGNPKKVEYLGVLTLKYKYNNGGNTDVECSRKFLVYAKRY